MKKTFEINPIVIKETKKAKWTYQNRDSMNEASKFEVQSCKPKTMVVQALIFDTESWIPWTLCSLSSTFGIKSWILGALCFLFSTFDIESWRPKELGFWSPTFGIKSWKRRASCYWSSTFNAKSWGPRALKVGDQEPNALGPQLSTSKVNPKISLQLGLNFWHQKLKTNARLDSIFRHGKLVMSTLE